MTSPVAGSAQDGAAPAFTSVEQCKEWLARQPRSNPLQMQALLTGQLARLNRTALDPVQRLQILERLREPLHFAQNECARRFAGRPLPLAVPEQQVFEGNRTVWHKLIEAYGLCLEACLQPDSSLADHAALVVQRRLAALGAEQLDSYRAQHDTSPGFWHRLHQAYGAAERLGVADTPALDPLHHKRAHITPRAAYTLALLLHAASPYELGLRPLTLVYRWSQRWSRKAMLQESAPVVPKVPPLVVDLNSDAPGTFLPPEGGRLRWLDLGPLRHSLKKRILLLQHGASPAELKLGDELTAEGCEALLQHLYRRWCRGYSSRSGARRTGAGQAELASGFAAIHYYLTGKPFREQDSAWAYNKQQADELATFGNVSHRHEENFIAQHGIILEKWDILDEGPTGLRVERGADQPGHRLCSGQLVAVRQSDGKGFLLGCARWVQATAERKVLAGIMLLPGIPVGITARGTGMATTEHYQRAFELPAVPQLQAPASFILPPNSFRAGRLFQVMGDEPRQVRLTCLLERGSDFDRAEFEPA